MLARLVGTLIVALALWQVARGSALDRQWRLSTHRKDEPGVFWFTVIVQLIVGIIVLIAGTTSWSWGTR